MKKLFLFIIGLCLVGAGCSNVATNEAGRIIQTQNTPEEMFEALIEKPASQNVRNLQGIGEVTQGHNVYLKFEASDNFIQKTLIPLHDYKEVDCVDKVFNSLYLPFDMNKSLNFWNINELKKHPGIICYAAQGYKNKWTSEGASIFVLDPAVSGPSTTEAYRTVYFHETGI